VETGGKRRAETEPETLTAALVRELRETRDRKAELTARADEIRDRILDLCGHTAGAYPVADFGRVLVKAAAAHPVDVRKLRRKFPSVYRQVVREVPFLRVDLQEEA
jgi:transcriptional regulator GlxA family with amidase domain